MKIWLVEFFENIISKKLFYIHKFKFTRSFWITFLTKLCFKYIFNRLLHYWKRSSPNSASLRSGGDSDDAGNGGGSRVREVGIAENGVNGVGSFAALQNVRNYRKFKLNQIQRKNKKSYIRSRILCWSLFRRGRRVFRPGRCTRCAAGRRGEGRRRRDQSRIPGAPQLSAFRSSSADNKADSILSTTKIIIIYKNVCYGVLNYFYSSKKAYFF